VPIAILKYKAGIGLEPFVTKLCEKLPQSIAIWLSVSTIKGEEGYLEPEDIIIEPIASSPQSVHARDIEIYIVSHQYADRLKDLELRNLHIWTDALTSFVGHTQRVEGFVWTLLAPSAFRNFTYIPE
jgi:hypothetical protein